MKTIRKILKEKCLLGLIILSVTAITTHVLSIVYDITSDIYGLILFIQISVLLTNIMTIGIVLNEDDEDDELLLIEISEIEHMSTDEILRLSELLDGRRIGPYEKAWGREKLVTEFEGDVRWYQLGNKK